MIIITNQGTIGRGVLTENKLDEIHAIMIRRLARKGAKIDAVYHCPHHPRAILPGHAIKCVCRKPNTGMILNALRHFAIDKKKSFLIGLLVLGLGRWGVVGAVAAPRFYLSPAVGSYLVNEALKAIPDLKIVPIPGPNAAIAALSISGFPTEEFVFLGFPPHKKGRQTFFKNISEIKSAVVFYESKHRILKALENLEKFSEIGTRQIMIARELTKQFETIYRGTLAEIKPRLTDKNLLGEFVVVIDRT